MDVVVGESPEFDGEQTDTDGVETSDQTGAGETEEPA